MLANKRSKRRKVATIQRKKKTQINRINAAQPTKFAADDRNSLPGLTGILDADILSELVDEDPTYRLMKQAILSKDYEGFSRIDPYINSFWNAAAIVNGYIIIDDRIAIPSCLQKAVLSRLHRSRDTGARKP